MNKIKVGIVGGAGYTAGELIRILIHHPNIELNSVVSTSSPGKPLYDVHTDLIGDTEIKFVSELSGEEEVIFLCLGHGHSKNFLENNTISKDTKVIDLSNEFRLSPENNLEEREFIYGLPELQKDAIQTAQNIANPGCFATTIQLGILPLAAMKELSEDIHINAITGSTGAGRGLYETTHFSYRNNNLSTYKVFTHQHLGEINQTISKLQPDYDKQLNFIPVRGDFPRGIFAVLHTKTTLSEKELKELYKGYYENHPFAVVSDSPIHLKQAIGTNKCIVHVEKKDGYAIITSISDNLIKGASGQAVQNLNLMFGWEEKLGLNLKPLAL